MVTTATHLLRMLEPSVRPQFAAPGIGSYGSAPLEQQSFAQLLASAATGKVHSGRQIETACELGTPLSASQMERLAAAGDLAEASGSKRALMMIDGRGLVMDVPTRTIVGELSANDSARMFNVDSTIYVTRDDESQFQGLLPPPGGGVVSSVLDLVGATTGSARSRERH